MESMFRKINPASKIVLVVGTLLLAFAAYGYWNSQSSVLAETDLASDGRSVSDLYIIVFSEPALAGYDGSIPGYPEPGRMPGKAKLDVKSPSSLRYLNYLDEVQPEHEANISAKIGRGEGLPEGSVLTINVGEDGKTAILIDSATPLAPPNGVIRLATITFIGRVEDHGPISFGSSTALQSVSDGFGNNLAVRWVEP